MLRMFSAFAAIRATAAALIAAGAIFYVIGLCLILRRYAWSGAWNLARDWDNANCILHGALSITGFAAVVSGLFPGPVILTFWAVVLAMFAIIESIEVVRLATRLRAFGWAEGICVYVVSQWARNFTFGMFYAFTLAASRCCDSAGGDALSPLRARVLAYGQYVVLLLLLAEFALAARSCARRLQSRPSVVRR